MSILNFRFQVKIHYWGKNLDISTCEPKQKTSQYKEVYWSESKNKWWVVLGLQGTKNKFGGYFDDELDAAKRLNQLCEEFGIPHKNHGISAKPNEEWQVI